MQKNTFQWMGLLFVLLAMTFQSCLKDTCKGTRTFIQYDPVYLQVDEIRQNIEIGEPRELTNPGKLYFYNDYIFINEIREGFHVIDNSNPSAPNPVAFVSIPGNVDIAVKENTLYADNYIDLLAIDISDPHRPVLKHRAEDVFSTLWQQEDLGFLVYYEETERTVEITCDDPRFGSDWFWEDDFILVDAAGGFDNSVITAESGNNVPTTGIAGSLSRFAIYDCYLYAIDQSNLQIFDIKNTTKPIAANTVQVGWGIETLFPYGENLFIGSQSGMFIFSNADPLNPVQLSIFQHARACDPVYVQGDYAFVTLRGGTECEGFNNQLDVIDISDLEAPELVQTYPMDNPHGLSIKEEVLYLCEGVHGLKVFDITDLNAIDENMLSRVRGFDAYDVIALPNKSVLFVIGKDGFYQFDTSDNTNLTQLSVLSVQRP